MQKPPKLETALTRMLQIDYPIIAAPMFLISDARLTTAVCKAGGTAAFPALNFRPIEAFREEVKKVKAQTSAPFGVNIIVQETNKLRDAQVDICLEEKVAYIVTSLGSPAALIKKAHDAGTKVFCDVVNEKHAQKAVDSGADALIGVTGGAGGHAGDRSPFALIPLLKRRFSVPVIAAGSIVDGRGLLAALSLGADGVYMGTRFIASDEATVPGQYKEAILRCKMDDVVNTDRVDGFPGNFIRTPDFKTQVPDPGVFENLLRLSPKLEKNWRLYRASKTLFGSPAKLKASYKTVFSAGHGAGLIEEMRSAEQIVYSVIAEYAELKKMLP